MPNPCDFTNETEFVSVCIAQRQTENPDEDISASAMAAYKAWQGREGADPSNKAAEGDNVVYKAGLQSDDDPFVFVMSTASVDRVGDIVEQDWNLREFRKNPIALWAHRHGEPIGVWERVCVEGNKLIGRLKLAEKGTSKFIDMVRSLIEQRILRAVSVGFRSDMDKSGPIDDKDPWGGWRLAGNELLECSVVTIPANAEALSVAKALNPKASLRFTAERGCVPDRVSGEVRACVQLGLTSRDSDQPKPNHETQSTERKHTMSLSVKIRALQEEQTETQKQLEELIVAGPGEDADADATEAHDLQVEELTSRVDKQDADLGRLVKAEAALGRKAVQTPSAKARADATSDDGQLPRIEIRKTRAKGHNATATVASLLVAHVRKISPVDAARSLFKDEPEIQHLVRAATDPASTTDATWAGPLVRETWGDFITLLRSQSVYPTLPGMRLEFDSNGTVNLPRETGRGSLAGGFVGENAPIPVKEGSYDNVDLSPKEMKVISSFSKKVATHSIPAIQGLVQDKMVRDTAEVLDTIYLDATARDAIRPAGLQDPTETGAANIVAASGVTVAAVLADTEAMVGRVLDARAGSTAVWIINPKHVLRLRNMQDAASGEFVFRAELAAGTFMGYPYLSSENVTQNLLTLQTDGAVTYATDYGPEIEVSDTTTLVYDDAAPDHIVDAGVATTQPVKSMFQIDGVAVKFKQGMDWRIVRQGGVQILTGFLV